MTHPRIEAERRATMSVDEINALIPELELLFQRLIALRREITLGAHELERLGYDPIHGPRRELPSEIRQRRDQLEAAVAAFEYEVDRLGSLGGVLQDLDLGLVDFLHDRDGVVVALCWQFGEPAVTHYHPLGASPSERRRLPEAPAQPLPH